MSACFMHEEQTGRPLLVDFDSSTFKDIATDGQFDISE